MIVVFFGFDIPQNHFRLISILKPVLNEKTLLEVNSVTSNLRLETTKHMNNCMNFIRRHEICRVWEVPFLITLSRAFFVKKKKSVTEKVLSLYGRCKFTSGKRVRQAFPQITGYFFGYLKFSETF